MNRRNQWVGSLLVGGIALALAAPGALAQTQISVPDYGSGASAGAMSNNHFNTPESDGRPGVYYFELGAWAFRKHDYAHAIDMYKVAASWAYKPAEYNLALMHFRGEGIPVNRPLGAAWAVLAAERGSPQYVKARDAMVTLLNKTEFAQTDQLWGKLKTTYGDKVALRRAKAQWAWVRTHQTGTRVGGAVGELFVGANDTLGTPVESGKSGKADMFAAGFGYLPGGSMDGSVAYRQFQQSDNPYGTIFLKNRIGTAAVGPLTPVKPGEDTQGAGQKGTGSQPPPSSHPPANG